MNELLRDLPEAIDILRKSQKFPPLTETQLRMIELMVGNHNSAHQLPTGSGKTYGPVCLPSILDILRDSFGHGTIPVNTRTLYIVPLVNIFSSLSSQMKKLAIHHQVLEAGSEATIDKDAKVICISPEKLLDPGLLKNIY